MRRDTLFSAVILLAAFSFLGWVRSVDWSMVWITDVEPWLTWDGSDGPEAAGEGWIVLGAN